MGYKIAHQYLYTETVYYDDNDVEVGRDRMYDDQLWDTLPSEPLEDWERDQYDADGYEYEEKEEA